MKLKTVLLSLLMISSVFVAMSTMTHEAEARYFFYDDFDPQPMAGWTATGLWHFVNDFSDPCIGHPVIPHPSSSYSPYNSFGYHLDTTCLYDTGAANWGYLTSPSIDLSMAGAAWLHFYIYYEVQDPNTAADTMYVEASDDGSSWLPRRQIVNDIMSSDYLPELQWVHVNVDLTMYSGLPSVWIRFAFNTVNDLDNDHLGWYVDDVLIDDVVPPSAAPFPFYENFNMGPGPGWSWTPYWHPVDDTMDPCMVEGDAVTSYVGHPKTSFSSPGSMAYNIRPPNPRGTDCTYEDGDWNKGWLESPPIDVSSTKAAHLSFWFWTDVEPGFEALEVQISTDHVNYTLLDDLGSYMIGAAGVSGSYRMGMWNFYGANISQYTGGTIWIRFYFDTLDPWVNAFAGWYIDDFAIKEFPTIQSQYFITNSPPTIDGTFDTDEWIMNDPLGKPDGANNWDDLTLVPDNQIGGDYLIVMNDFAFLYVMYDAIGDTSNDGVADGAHISFDPLNDDLIGASGDLDDEYGIDAIGGPGGYHYTNGVFADACAPPAECAHGFGASPNSIVAHNIYEFKIPFLALGFGSNPLLPWPLTLGYTMGFAGSAGPTGLMAGVYDNSLGVYDQWPLHPMPPGPLAQNQFGDIIIGVPQVLANDYPLRETPPQPTPTPPPYVLDEIDTFQFESNSWDHAVIGIRQTDFVAGDDFGLIVATNTTFSALVEASFAPSNTTELIVLDKSTYPTPPNIGAAVGFTAGAAPSEYDIEIENDFDDYVAGDNWDGWIDWSAEGLEVLDAFEITAPVAGNYEFRLGMDSMLDLDFFLFNITSPAPTEASRAGINPPVASSETDGYGITETIGPVPLDVGIDYLLVVTNENNTGGARYMISPPETLDVAWTDLAPATVEQWEVSVEMLALNLVSSGNTAIEGVKLTLNGTATDTDISAVAVYDDVNLNNIFDGADVLLGRGQFFLGVAYIYFNSPLDVDSAGKTLLAMANIASTATVGATFGINVTWPSDIFKIDPDTVNMPTKPESSLATINAGSIPTIYSEWQGGGPIPDGTYAPGEHIQTVGTNAINLRTIAGNAVPAWLIVENNDTYLYVTYDVVGDTTNESYDVSSFSLDTDNDDGGTDGEDDEFNSRPQHFTYDAMLTMWTLEDACDPSHSPLHAGLACARGFGPSPNSMTPHKIYEYRIPLVLIEASPIPATPIGFGGVSQGASDFAIWDDSNPFFYDTWPQFYYWSIPPLSEYGDLLLASGPPDPAPLIEAWEPGGSAGQIHNQGDVITVLWNASDNNPWPSAGNVVNISYGMPGSWTPIMNDEFEDGIYQWDTTGVPLGTYYINVSVYDDAGQESWDMGNATFDIVDPPPVIEAWEPGGSFGQTITTGQIVNVIWNASDNNLWPNLGNVVNISYGMPGSWTPIMNDEFEDGIYQWDTTLVLPGTYYINVSVYDDAGQESWDMGNNTFDIVAGDPPPFVEAWEPGGTIGQSYAAGTPVDVLWDASDNNPWPNADYVVNISYGMPGSWTPIINDELEDGIYQWDTTGVPPGTYYINISVYDDAGQESWDMGNATFDIVNPPPVIEAWEPGGTTMQTHVAGTIVDVLWNASDNNPWPSAGDVVNISYGMPGSWTPIVNDEFEDGIYQWDTASVPIGSYYINVSVYDDNGQESWDIGNETFEIIDTAPTIEAWEPGGTSGQEFTQGNTVVVTWQIATDNLGLPTNPINISYGNASGWTTIALNQPNTGTYNWDTSGVPCGNAYYINISVYDSLGQTTFDSGNNTFNIVCPGSIIGEVEDKNGAKIDDATVELYDSDDNLVDTDTTNSDGEFEFPDVDVGTDYSIKVIAEGYEEKTKRGVDVGSGEEEDVGTIVLDTDATISGTVLDENGDPIEGATVTLLDDEDNVLDTTTTDANGDYEFPNLDYGTYKVKVSKAGYNDQTSNTITIDKDNLSPTVPDMTLASTAGVGDWLWILIIIVVVVVVLIVVLLMLRRKKKPETWEKPEPEVKMPEEEIPPPLGEMPLEEPPAGPPGAAPPPPPPPPPAGGE